MAESNAGDAAEQPNKPQLGPDEMFCTECGEAIKKAAEVCPECGVPQQGQQQEAQEENSVTDRRKYELEKAAGQGKATMVLLGFFAPPIAYWMLGKKGLAVLNILTLNYLLFGLIIVPIHATMIVSNAREELRVAGVSGY